MESRDLTRRQLEALRKEADQHLRYWRRVADRMLKRRFPSDDKLLRDVASVNAALQDLGTELHYLSCGNVVMRQEPPADRDTAGGG